MAQNEQRDKGDDNPMSNYAKYSGIGFQMVVIIGVFAFAGYKIDEAGNHKVKWATAALSLIGVFIAMYVVIRAVKN